MILQTKHKIFLASLAYHPIHIGRRLLGRSNIGQFHRKGLEWELDLGEVVDFMIYLSGGFENYLSDFIRRNLNEGMIAMDIGANIGAHTLPMGQSVGSTGQAHAVEATEYAFEKLTRNIALNPEVADQIKPYHCMLLSPESDIEAAADCIHSSWPFNSSDERHDTHQGVGKTVGAARKTTLDQLAEELDLERLDLIKLDVDGNEWDVLSGGATTLEKFSPVIIMEVAPDYHEAGASKGFANIHALLTDLGYRFFLFNGNPLPAAATDLAKTIPAGASINVVIVKEGQTLPQFSR